MANGGDFLQGFNQTFNPTFQNQRDFLLQVNQTKFMAGLHQREQVLQEQEALQKIATEKFNQEKGQFALNSIKSYVDMGNKMAKLQSMSGQLIPGAQEGMNKYIGGLGEQQNNALATATAVTSPQSVYMSPEDKAAKMAQIEQATTGALLNQAKIDQLKKNPSGIKPSPPERDRARYVYLEGLTSRTHAQETEFQSLAKTFGPTKLKNSTNQLAMQKYARNLAIDAVRGQTNWDPLSPEVQSKYLNHFLIQLQNNATNIVPPTIKDISGSGFFDPTVKDTTFFNAQNYPIGNQNLTPTNSQSGPTALTPQEKEISDYFLVQHPERKPLWDQIAKDYPSVNISKLQKVIRR
jgi:hypothetical protein